MPSPKIKRLSLSLIFEFIDFFGCLNGILAGFSPSTRPMSLKSRERLASVSSSYPGMPMKQPEGGVEPTSWNVV